MEHEIGAGRLQRRFMERRADGSPQTERGLGMGAPGAGLPQRTPESLPESPAESRLAALERLLGDVLRSLTRREPLRWINASVGQVVRPIPVEEVLYFQSDTKYTRVVLADGEALIRTSMKALQAGLDPARFWPIHRSTIVNAHAIAGITRDERGRVQVRLKQRAERLAVSEGHAGRFRQM